MYGGTTLVLELLELAHEIERNLMLNSPCQAAIGSSGSCSLAYSSSVERRWPFSTAHAPVGMQLLRQYGRKQVLDAQKTCPILITPNRMSLASPSPPSLMRPPCHRLPIHHRHYFLAQLLSQLILPAPCARVHPARLNSGCPASPHVIFFLGTDRSAIELHLSVVSSL
jgi:hypothetical protein